MSLLKKLFKFTFLGLILGGTIFILSVTFFIFKCIHDSPSINLSKLYENPTSRIFDQNGDLVLELGIKKQNWINYNDIDSDLINAVISVEDSRFFNHNGADYKRLLKATVNNVLSASFKEGASTITDQLIKNVYLSDEKSFKRKIQEYYMAIKLEQSLTKPQIIEAYLNNILFGSNIYGINRASLYYFGHDATDLSISEAALLAGLIQLPNYYNPYQNYDAAIKRRNLVINLMYENKYISNENKNDALKEKIVLSTKKENNLYISYMEKVIDELANDYRINVYTDGVDVYTYLNQDMQLMIEDVLYTDNYLEPQMKIGIACLDNDGKIEALGGTRNPNEFGLNYSYMAKLQPGSTIKPLIDYGPAFEYLNYGTGNIICDEPYTYKNGDKINNWDYTYKGNITLRQALAWSRNVPAVKLYNEVGYDKCHSYIKSFGLISNETPLEANAIGGFTYGFSVLEIANAYMTYANMGKYQECKTVNYVIGENKNENKIVQACKVETAFMINDILHTVIAGSKYDIYGQYLCAKTGQTNYDLDTRIKYNIPNTATKDSWFVGYNSKKTIGVWVGTDFLGEKCFLDNLQKEIPRNIFKMLMSKYSPSTINEYKVPSSLVRVLIEKGFEKPYLASLSSINKSYEYFYRGTEPKVKKESIDEI